ncbi:GPI-anchored wall transfer protein 1 [[Candida] railenensis]|uniref:GPI-anchored wall transfer protein n=1 Tax=[Candida] railenensis TaxID=45579 RepID=A0A9P0QUA9_9ASCO|nr:GPI-anchored wall transfer protein 1 [[Candida] railenensis]
MSTLKEKKELFVSDLLGGSISEIYYVTGVALSAYLAVLLLQKYQIPSSVPFDYFLNKLTLLMSITIYSNHVKILHLLILLPVTLAVLYKINDSKSEKSDTKKNKNNKNSRSKIDKSVDGVDADEDGPKPPKLLVRKSFLTAYRASMIIITNLSILAVDFKIFPRRFAKVETWGTSLMDLGVGSFVFSMGLVNSRSIIKQIFAQENKRYRFSISQYVALVWKNTVKALPILLLGFIRLVSVKSLEYQEHVTEYGIHWNFFFTLGFLPIVIGILDPFLNIFPRAFVAMSIGLIYEVALSQFDVLKFILRTDNRMESIITQNKEGIFSFFGYLSIFIFGQSFGSFVLTDFKTPKNLLWTSTYKEYEKMKLEKGKGKKKNSFISRWLTVTTSEGLLITTIFYQLLFLYTKDSPYFNNISRRIANLPYVLWVVSYNSFFLLGYKAMESTVFRGEKKQRTSTGSMLLEAVNNNGLLCFLLGNLGTGLINMSIDTIECSDGVAFGILCAYGLVLTVIMIVLDLNGIYVKI